MQAEFLGCRRGNGNMSERKETMANRNPETAGIARHAKTKSEIASQKVDEAIKKDAKTAKND
jgi:hypothetical protein